jgi:hypothetical protein
MTIFTPSSTEKSFKADDCSISINGIQFSKLLNNKDNLIKQLNKNKVEINSGPKSDFFIDPNGQDKYHFSF